MGTALALALGAALVVLVARDALATVGHPNRQGTLSRVLMRSVWRLTRAVGRGPVSPAAGPLGMVVTVVAWGGLASLGWALVYWTQIPDGFSYAEGIEPPTRSNPLDALYVSLVTLATLGLGDLVPTTGWLRLVTATQALFGFALLTAAVSWLSQVYPALSRRRALAGHVDLLRRAGVLADDGTVSAATGATTLHDLAGRVVQVRVDLVSFPESYWFPDPDSHTCLAVALPWLDDLAGAARNGPQPEVRQAGVVLTHALDDLARELGTRFVHGSADSPAAAFHAYLAEQGRAPR